MLLIWPSRRFWRLTEPYTHPRLWQPDSGLAEMRGARRRDDFNGRVLRVATFHDPPLVYIENPADPSESSVPCAYSLCSGAGTAHSSSRNVWLAGNVYGMEWAVLETVAEYLNFTWSVVLTNSSERFGRPNGDSSWKGGALGAVINGEADLGLNAWVQLDQSRVVDFTSYSRVRVSLEPNVDRLKNFGRNRAGSGSGLHV